MHSATIKIMTQLITYYSLRSCCFISVMYKYFLQNFVPRFSQSAFCPVDTTDHVPHWPFIDGTMLTKTKHATKEKNVINNKGKAETPF